MMLTRFDVFDKELRGLIDTEIDRLKEEMASGSLKTLEEFRHASGKIIGLRCCLDYIDEASSIVNKRLGS